MALNYGWVLIVSWDFQMLHFQYYMTAPELYFESHDGTAIDGVVAHREEQASKIYNNSNNWTFIGSLNILTIIL